MLITALKFILTSKTRVLTRTMDPWKSWGVVAVVGVGAYWYYSNQQKNKTARPTVTTEPAQTVRRKVEAKNKRKKDGTAGASDPAASDAVPVSVPSSSGEQAKNRKGGNKRVVSSGKSSAVDVTSKDVPLMDGGAGDDEIDNKEFARQLTSVKAGTSLTNTSKAVKPPKTVKQSRLNGVEHGAPHPAVSDTKDSSGDSSTTGADADDDTSATSSPEFGATRRGETGVSDLLEAPAPGPSVLRLTESTKPQRSRTPKQSKATEAQETKKQRQRKVKKEAEKAAQEHAEKERRVLLEKQLRTAREARGEPAKNGVPVPAPPKSNAWAKPANDKETSSAQMGEASRSNIPLLDTFDRAPELVNGTEQHAEMKRDPESSVSDSKLSDVNWPSEEEQMRMLDELEGSGSWQTVNGKKHRGGKKPEADPQAVKEAGAKSNTLKSGHVKSRAVESGGVPSHPVTPDSVLSDPASGVVAKQVEEKPRDVTGKSENVRKHPEDVTEKIKNAEAKSDDVEENTQTTTQQSKKAKKGEYLPYKDKPHPHDSDWRVV